MYNWDKNVDKYVECGEIHKICMNQSKKRAESRSLRWESYQQPVDNTCITNKIAVNIRICPQFCIIEEKTLKVKVKQMKLTMITVGKLKEKYWLDAVKEYQKRISKYAKIELIEVADEKEPNNAGPKDLEQIKDKEAEKILAKIKDTQHVVTLEINGKQYTSEKLAAEYQRWMNTGKSDVVFIIGGSNGIGDAVKKRSNQEISFGTLTYPHQMMKVMMLEQLFRVNKILRNESYHK